MILYGWSSMYNKLCGAIQQLYNPANEEVVALLLNEQ